MSAARPITRNVIILGRRTSIRLEPELWDQLDEVLRRERTPLVRFLNDIERRRRGAGRASAIRAYLVDYHRRAATDLGHTAAGHGRGNVDALVERYLASAWVVTWRRPGALE